MIHLAHMGVDIGTNEGQILGQFASNLGYTDLIDASVDVPALKDFFDLGYLANEEAIKSVVGALKKLSDSEDADDDVKKTAKGLATLIDGHDLIYITNGVSDGEDGEEEEAHASHAPTAVATAVIPEVDSETDQSRNIDAGFASKPGTSESSEVSVTDGVTAHVHADHSVMQSIVHKFFRAQASAVMDRLHRAKDLHKGKQKVRKDDEVAQPLDPDKVFDAVNDIPWFELVPLVQPQLLSAGTFGVVHGLHQAAVAGVGDITAHIGKSQELAAQYAKDRAAEMVGMKWDGDTLVENPNAKWSIAETTRDDLRSLITKALSEETNMDDLIKQIQDAGTFSESRAEMIAKQEIYSAQTNGVVGSWKQTAAVELIDWSCSSLGCCDICAANAAAGPIPFGTPFPSGDLWPGAHILCRCVARIKKVRKRESIQ